MNITHFKQIVDLFEDSKPEVFVGNIETATQDNSFYRKVLYTGPYIQLVIMSIPPGEEIGEEVHEKGDQFIRVEAGSGEFVLDGKSVPARDGESTVVPQGVKHNVINNGSTPLQLYVIYSPPEHPAGTEHETKSQE